MNIINDGILIIEEGTEKINESQFAENQDIREIVFPNSLLELEDQCFIGCSNLKKVICPPNLRRIGNGAFSMNYSLSKVVLNDNLLEIGAGAFSDCPNLTNIEIPPLITDIQSMTFYTSGLKEIKLGENIKHIGEDAFWGNESLKQVNILNPNIYIENCFGSCYKLAYGYIACGYPEQLDDFSTTTYTILGLSTFDKHTPNIQNVICDLAKENINIIMERILNTNNTIALSTLVNQKLLTTNIQKFLDKAFENKQNEIIALLLNANNHEEDLSL